MTFTDAVAHAEKPQAPMAEQQHKNVDSNLHSAAYGDMFNRFKMQSGQQGNKFEAQPLTIDSKSKDGKGSAEDRKSGKQANSDDQVKGVSDKKSSLDDAILREKSVTSQLDKNQQKDSSNNAVDQITNIIDQIKTQLGQQSNGFDAQQFAPNPKIDQINIPPIDGLIGKPADPRDQNQTNNDNNTNWNDTVYRIEKSQQPQPDNTNQQKDFSTANDQVRAIKDPSTALYSSDDRANVDDFKMPKANITENVKVKPEARHHQSYAREHEKSYESRNTNHERYRKETESNSGLHHNQANAAEATHTNKNNNAANRTPDAGKSELSHIIDGFNHLGSDAKNKLIHTAIDTFVHSLEQNLAQYGTAFRAGDGAVYNEFRMIDNWCKSFLKDPGQAAWAFGQENAPHVKALQTLVEQIMKDPSKVGTEMLQKLGQELNYLWSNPNETGKMGMRSITSVGIGYIGGSAVNPILNGLPEGNMARNGIEIGSKMKDGADNAKTASEWAEKFNHGKGHSESNQRKPENSKHQRIENHRYQPESEEVKTYSDENFDRYSELSFKKNLPKLEIYDTNRLLAS